LCLIFFFLFFFSAGGALIATEHDMRQTLDLPAKKTQKKQKTAQEITISLLEEHSGVEEIVQDELHSPTETNSSSSGKRLGSRHSLGPTNLPRCSKLPVDSPMLIRIKKPPSL